MCRHHCYSIQMFIIVSCLRFLCHCQNCIYRTLANGDNCPLCNRISCKFYIHIYLRVQLLSINRFRSYPKKKKNPNQFKNIYFFLRLDNINWKSLKKHLSIFCQHLLGLKWICCYLWLWFPAITTSQIKTSLTHLS